MPAGKHLPSAHCMRNNHHSVQQIQNSQEALLSGMKENLKQDELQPFSSPITQLMLQCFIHYTLLQTNDILAHVHVLAKPENSS